MKKFLKTALKLLIFFIGWAVCASLGNIDFNDPAIWRFVAELLPLLWVIIFTFVFWLIEKREITIPIKDNFTKGSFTGLITGMIWISITVSILLLLQCEKITGSTHVNMIWLWILSAFLNTIMQELLVRGYIYQKIKKEYSIVPAMILTTALFTALHGGAFEAGLIPVLNVITMSLFVTALYECTGTLMAPIMAHASWNILGGVVFGCVSLAEDYPHLFDMTSMGNPIISGGNYMIEGSIVVLLFNSILFIFFWKKYKNHI